MEAGLQTKMDTHPIWQPFQSASLMDQTMCDVHLRGETDALSGKGLADGLWVPGGSTWCK